jgi:hypothetical protein
MDDGATCPSEPAAPAWPDVAVEVRRLLKAAGRCPRPGVPVPSEYVQALLELRKLAAPGWWEPTAKNCRSGPLEEWYDLLAPGIQLPVATFWGRKDGSHMAAAYLVAALVNLLPELAAELLERRGTPLMH